MGGRGNHQHSPPWSLLSDADYGDDRWSTSEATATKEQDWHLPIANVGRIMKKSLPANAKISKEAKGVIQECVSEFIGFITGEASDKCRREKRKTINGDDLLWAMTTLGFESYAMPLKTYMDKYRETNNVPREEENSSPTTEGSDQYYSSMLENNSVACSGMKEIMSAQENSSRQGLLNSANSEIYCFGGLMAHGFVDGGMVGEYGQDFSEFSDFTITLGESSKKGEANVATYYGHGHGLVQGFY
ncbi:hypothetical protein Taro_039411 [Colocasia esculenta]|uniref:Transcription factor CBF/NF-Y/archaeal histone domain-containing protein n=1 Tax=Colocasia esculenta TaxID=4460 RepID=A0A843WFP8_COLES|nr:hypothetical protein [Colocasia esculenta]